MATVYILNSATLELFYIGSCKELSFRLEQHLTKEFKQSFTSKASDWELYYKVENLEYKQARQIELHIKKMRSRSYIQNLKTYPEIVQKLILRYH